MPKLKNRDVVITMDMNGCPNRCKHCWIDHTPNKKVNKETLIEVVKEF